MSPAEWLIFVLTTIALPIWAISAVASTLYLHIGYRTPWWKAASLGVALGPLLLVAGEAHERFARPLKPIREKS